MPPLPPLGRDGIKNDEASLALGQKKPLFYTPARACACIEINV